jgi:predicted PurR-regulated permease PerM
MLIVVAIAVGFWLLYRLREVVFSLLLAFVITTAIRPVVAWLNRRGVSRAEAIIAVYLLAVFALGVLLWFLLPNLVEQGALLVSRTREYYRFFVESARASSNALIRQFAWRMPAQFSAATPPTAAADNTLVLITQAFAAAEAVGKRVFVGVAVLLLAFYWLIERERVLRSALLLVPAERRESVREFYDAAEEKVGAYMRGLGWLCLSVGGLSLAAYLLIGLPAALLLAIIAGLMEIIPVVGPVLGALPALVVALSVDPSKVIWVVAAAAAIQLIENAVLVPRLMGKTVGVNPLMTLLALAALGAMFGIAGAFLAVPLAALAQLLLDRVVLTPAALGQPAPDGRDQLSALRVEIQELMKDVRKQVRDKPEVLEDGSDDIEDSIEAVAQDLDSVLARAMQVESNGR